MKSQILKEGDPRLTTPASYINIHDGDYKYLINRLKHCYEALSPIQGLSLPQCGNSFRAIIVRINKKPIVMINPEEIARFGKKLSIKEGCESVEGRYNVWRPRWLFVSYIGEDKKLHRKFLRFKWARIFDHEYDHLDGVLISKKGVRTYVR